MKSLEEIKDGLSAEFPKHLVSFRPGSANYEKTSALPLAYIDARDVMDRLDSVVGFDNWQDRYEFHGTRTVCYLSIKIGDEWITKADGAGDTNMEGEKGGISDALKRAAVKWGIGRYLYHLEFKWAPVDSYDKNGKKYVKGFKDEFRKNPWAWLVRDQKTYDVAKNAAKGEIQKILSDKPTDPKILGRFQQNYPELAMAVDMISELQNGNI